MTSSWDYKSGPPFTNGKTPYHQFSRNCDAHEMWIQNYMRSLRYLTDANTTEAPTLMLRRLSNIKTMQKFSTQSHILDTSRNLAARYLTVKWMKALAPVPLSIFRSNSKFDENSNHSSVKYTLPITTIFCTRHDSVTVVTCAKYRCDRLSIFETRAFWIFIEFRIRSKYA